VRIALTHPRASDVGGVERQAHSVAQALLDAGHEVHFFCQRADASIDPRIAVHRVSNPLRPVRWFKVWWFDRACERAVSAAGPFDLVHGFGKTSRQDVYFDGSGCLADFQTWSIDGAIESPWRRRLRRASPHQRVIARIERARYTRGNYRRVLAISELVRRQILDRYQLPAGDVERLYPGVDLERFAPDPAAREHTRRVLGVGDAVPLVAFLGSDYRRKGIATLLAAPRLKMVAVKDFYWEKGPKGWAVRNCPLGQGMVDWPKFLGMLAAAKFAGPVSLHVEYEPGGETEAEKREAMLAAAERDLQFLRAQFKAAYATGSAVSGT